MLGGNVNEFIDHTTYEECAVMYKGEKYFFHGLICDNKKNRYSYEIDLWDNAGNFIKNLFDKTFTSSEECIKVAQEIPIFNGKTFWEAEKEMEWIEW
jgi:hypothetical protein